MAKNVLFLCTGNSARSIVSEMLLTHLGNGDFIGHSAGSHPSGKPVQTGLDMLTDKGIDVSGARSKSWEEFSGEGAVKMDAIITVCDNAAGEVCPIWPGHPVTAHWPLPDPAHIEPESARREAFEGVYAATLERLKALMALDWSASPEELKANLRNIPK